MARKKEYSYETEKLPFPSQLKSLMESTRTRQWELAKAICMRPQTVSLYVKGQSFPDVNGLTKIADYFHVSADYLLGRSENPTIEPDIINACNVTGLSQKSVENIVDSIRKNRGAWRKINGEEVVPYKVIDMLNMLLESKQFVDLFECLGLFLIYGNDKFFNNTSVNVTGDEINRVIDHIEKDGYSVAERGKLSKLNLQLACDELKAIFYDVLKKEINVSSQSTKDD